jgi:tetratricopeptide (TPR) repeat protein
MKSNFRICPQCSTRNRLDKEFCVKCGEPLEGVKAGDAAAAPPGSKAKPGFVLSEDDQGQNPIVPFLIVLAALGVAFAGWVRLQNAPAPPPPPTAVPLTQASVPAPRESGSTPTPGADAYAAGQGALRNGNLPEAVAAFRLAVEAAGDNGLYRFALADALYRSGEMNDALAEYEAAVQRDSRNVRYATDWARALGRAGRSTDAVAVYETVISMAPDDADALRSLANIHLRSMEPVKARPYLERLAGLLPNDPTQKIDLGRVLEGANDLVGAAAQYQAALAISPGIHLARTNLAEVYMKQNRGAEAIAVLDEGIRANAAEPVLYREKGRVMDRLGRNQEAVAAYREYVRLAPNASDIRVFTDRIAELSNTSN